MKNYAPKYHLLSSLKSKNELGEVMIKPTREELIEDLNYLNIPIDENDNILMLEMLLEAAKINDKYKHLFGDDGRVIKNQKNQGET